MRIVPELEHQSVLFESALNDPPLHSAAAAMDDANFAQSLPMSLLQILFDN